MNESNEQLLASARSYVTDLFSHRVRPDFVFHNLEHTEEVVEACSHIAEHYDLKDEDKLVLLLAAWFHDTGYTSGQAEGHEDVSIDHAFQFLQGRRVSENIVQRVTSCIKATRMPQSPITEVEKILCDADLFHLSTEDFRPRNQLLKQERESILGHKIDKKEWRKSNVVFLETHQYFTGYGEENLEPKKLENLDALKKKKKVNDVKEEEKEEAFPYLVSQDTRGDNKEIQKNTARGIQTMFRTTINNHIELSSLADGKANIMISVNAIIISVVLTVMLVRLPFYPQYLIPTIILVIACLGAMIFAILATRPSVSSGTFTEEDIRTKKTNLLFFGNFFGMRLEQYEWGMNEMLKDHQYLYNSMIKDIYFLGVVLARKYKLLRIAYTIFMWGLITAVVAFSVAAVLSEATTAAANTSTPTIDY